MQKVLPRGSGGAAKGCRRYCQGVNKEWLLPGEALLENLLGDYPDFFPIMHRRDYTKVDEDLLLADGDDVALELLDVLQVLEVQAGDLGAGGHQRDYYQNHQDHQRDY